MYCLLLWWRRNKGWFTRILEEPFELQALTVKQHVGMGMQLVLVTQNVSLVQASLRLTWIKCKSSWSLTKHLPTIHLATSKYDSTPGKIILVSQVMLYDYNSMEISKV